jgi:sugar/nucleoside kinase (ribokinase family)
VVGRVGADAAGRLVREALATAGVEPLLAIDPDVPTGCVIAVGTGIVADRGASVLLAPDDLPSEIEAGAVLVSGYSLLQAPAAVAARAAIDRARTKWLAVDAASARLLEAFGVDPFLDATATVDVLLANAEEARVLTGRDGEEAALELARRYPVACVKLGPDGAVAASGEAIAHAASRRVERSDTIGAGDAFAAGFLLALSAGTGLQDAVRAGCAAAAEVLRA